MALFGPPNIEKLKEKRNVKGLIKALGYEKDESVRNAAVDALKEIGDPAVDGLISSLADNNSYVRIGAAGALGDIGSPKAVEPLCKVLENEDKEMGKLLGETRT